MKKLLSVLVALLLIMTFVACDNSAKVDVANSFGYDAVSKVINSAEDFLEFAREVAEGNSYAGEVVVLNANVTLSAEEFIPVGTLNNSFQGTFDGNDNTITYACTYNKLGEDVYLGLFGSTLNAEIRNLNVVVDASEMVASNGYVLAFGAVVGFSSGDITISNVSASGEIVAFDSVGGLVGRIEESESVVIENCLSEVNLTSYFKGEDFSWTTTNEDGEEVVVTIPAEEFDVKVGGFVGSIKDVANAEINDCAYYGVIKSGKWASACIGGVEASEVYVSCLTGELRAGFTGSSNIAEGLGWESCGYCDAESRISLRDSLDEEWKVVTLIEAEADPIEE